MAETALYDPVVVEPELTASKVEELLSRGRESAKLDYKRQLDPSDTAVKVALVKDVLAMSNTAGGYLVVGVSDQGKREGLTRKAAERIDEAVIRAQVAGYTTGPIRIFVNNDVESNGLRFAIITILPVSETIIVAESDGNRPGRSKPAFRKGDVLVRHGSASERWNQADVEFLLRRVIDSRKEEWLRDFGDDLRSLVGDLAGSAPLPVGPAAFDLSAKDFQDLVIGLARGSRG
jgi:hypothetical protein